MRIIKFKTEFRPGKNPVDWVEVAAPGEGFESVRTWHRVNDLKPRVDDGTDMQPGSAAAYAVHRWSLIEKAYKAWKEGEDMPDEGTPLAAWSGVTQEHADVLKKFGIRTVEDFANAQQSAAQKFGFPRVMEMQSMAKKFLESRTDVEKDARLAELEQQVANLTALAASAAPAEVATEDGEDTERRRPGRPRKEAA